MAEEIVKSKPSNLVDLDYFSTIFSQADTLTLISLSGSILIFFCSL